MIISLRGTHASGKTFVVRSLLKRFEPKAIYGALGPRWPEAYELKRGGKKKPLYVLGPYDAVPTSGADAITPGGLDILIALVEKYRKKGDVLFEGILVSSNFGSVGEYLKSHNPEVVVAFMDTPLEKCLEDLARRQETASRTGKSDKHVRIHFKRISRVRKRMEDLKMRCETVDRATAVDQILSWLQ